LQPDGSAADRRQLPPAALLLGDLSLLRSALFQVHWFAGITVGIVIALVGATGAILSFEPEILNALNRDVRTISGASGEHLAPPELLARLRAADPSRRVATLAVWSDPSRAARVTYAAEESPSREAAAGPPPRGEVRYVDPRPGGVAAARGDRGEVFFRTVRSLHRWLIADRLGDRDVGRQIVGAATIVLVFLTLSGLYQHGASRSGSVPKPCRSATSIPNHGTTARTTPSRCALRTARSRAMSATTRKHSATGSWRASSRCIRVATSGSSA